MRMKTDPAAVWAEYEEGRRYNEAIDLYKNVESYEAFYTGDQWRGLNAPDLMKVQLNFLGRVVSACIAKVVSDDFTAAFTPFEHTSWTDTASAVLTREVERAAELINLRHLHKENVRDAAVDGDACNYFWFDPEAPYGGRIRAESVENTAVLFGNPYEKDVQLQPYIILALRRRVEDVKEEAASFGADDETLARIAADRNADRPEKDGEDRLCTVLVKFFKQDGEVRCLKTTEHALVRPAFHTGLTLYPVAWMN